MRKERDLLPWILGGLSATAVAVAFTAISTNKTANPNIPPAPAVASQPLSSPSTSPTQPVAVPQPAAVPEAAPLSAALPTSSPAPDQAQVAAAGPVQAAIQPEAAGQIWVCTTKGIKTYSNNPCGEKSTLLDVGPINTMNATPLNRYPRGYEPRSEPRYAPAYNEQGPGPEDYSEQYGTETGANSYTIVQGLAFVPRRRVEHPHRPPYHHHNPMPVRRY